ncbi:hypothetical protein ABW17_26875 [Mycobacterium nebraskense]|nr:hypothetical protein ABW17_26875 [Mycobacterium nebraskense]
MVHSVPHRARINTWYHRNIVIVAHSLSEFNQRSPDYVDGHIRNAVMANSVNEKERFLDIINEAEGHCLAR